MAILALLCAVGATSVCWARGRDQKQNPPRNNNQRHTEVPRPNQPQSSPRQGESRPQNAPQFSSPSAPSHHSGQWLRRYKDMAPDQQKHALDNDPQFRQLPPERQQRLRNRLQRFNNLPPVQQQRVLNRMEVWEHLTPTQKQDARKVYGEIRSLPQDRRRAMQNAIGALRAMPPDARRRAIESGRFSQYSPQERDLLRGISELPLAPAETESNSGPPHP
jgi:hypothetical protein